MLFAFNLPLANQIFEESEGRVQDRTVRLIIKAKHWKAKPEYVDKGETISFTMLSVCWLNFDTLMTCLVAEDYDLQA